MRQTTVLGLLACVLAAIAMLTVQLRQSPSFEPALVKALGAAQPDAPLTRRPAQNVRASIDATGFEVAAPKARVALHGVGTGSARWNRFSRGVSRPTSFGSETILVAPRKTEQFLTVDRRQGPKTWRWRLNAPKLTPRLGDDGAVGFVSGHTLAGLYVEPVALLDEAGRDVTPEGLEWSLGHDRKGWLLELALDDSELPLPYVIDPAIVLHSYASMANNGGGSPSLKLYKPIGTTANDFMLAMISVQGNRTITPPAGWTSVRRDTQGGSTLTQQIFRKTAVANEPGSYTFTFSGSDNATGGITPYIGVNNSSPIDASSGNPSSANSSTVTALSVTTTAANHLVVGFFGFNAARTFTPTAGMTERWDTMSSTTSTEAADYTQVAAGPTGNKTADPTGGGAAWIGQLVALRLDVTAPTQLLSVTEGTRPDLQYFDSVTATMFYNPAANGDFTVTSALTDAGPSQVTFPAITATGFTHGAEYRKQVLADEPLAYWRLGETSGTSAADATGSGNSGTYTGGVTLGALGALAGDSDTASSFDGVNDQVTVPHNAALNLNGSFSIEFWAKQTSFTNSFPGIINKGTSANANGYLIFANSTGTLGFKRNNVTVSTTAGALTTSYKHFVVIHDGTYVVWYVNGVFNNYGVVTYPANNTTAGLSLGLGDAGQYAHDVLDELAIYQTALSDTRITAHYGAGLTAGGDDVDTQTPFTSTSYRFDPTNTTEPAAQSIVGLDGAGNQVSTTLTFTRDVSAPTGMSATVTAGYYTSLSVPVTLDNGSDTGAGIDATSAIVERDEVALAADACGAFPGSWSTVVLTGGNDTSVQSGKCYRYRYKISDRVGNQGTQAGTSATAKVDTSAPTPAPTLSYGSFSNAALSGGVVYYRPGAAVGQFAVSAAGSSDPESGVTGYNFPAAAGGWSRSIAGATATYSHTGSPTDPVEPLNVTASNNAGLTSTASAFTVTPDASAPTGQSVALSGGPYYTSLSVALTPNDGSDTGSGLDTSTRVYERDEGTLSSGTCSGFPGTFATTVSNPDATVQSGRCYRYRLKISDLVGNQSGPSAPTADAKVDTSAPSDPSLGFGSFTAASATGSTVYYRPGAANGQFAVTGSSTDAESGVASYSFPATAAGWSRSIAGATATYSHTGSPSDPAEPLNVTATNNAGLSSGATGYTVTPDSSLPSSSIQCDGAACSAGWYTSSPVSVTLSASDTGSGLSQIKYTTDGSDPTLGNGIVYAGAFDLTATTTVKYRAWDNVGNAEAVQTKLVQIDATAPSVPTFSFSALTNAAATGQTVYFRTGVGGGFTITASASDGESGIASYSFPALGSGWSGSEAGASYDFSFTSVATDPVEPNNTTATNNAGLTSSPGSFTVTPDGLAPVSSILCDGASCVGGWYTSGVSVSLSANDPESGVQEIRFTTDGSDPSPFNGTVYVAPFAVVTTTTVKFRAYDRVGNEESVGSQLVRVDTSAPTVPALTLSESPASANQHVSGTTLYYNPSGSNSGSFTVDAATSDPQSGIEKVTFPAVTGMTGGGDDTASPYQGAYGWTSSTSGSGAQTVTAHNTAGLTSGSSFSVTPDTTAPTGQTAALVGGPYYTSASVGFTTGDGSDSGSSLDTSTRLVERASAPLTNGSCGGFGGYGGSYSSPDASVQGGNCYRYRFTISDNVGNASTPVVTADAKVDTSAPSATMDDPGANLRGTVTLTSTTGDPESGVATITYQRSPAGMNTWTATPSTWNTTLVADGLYDLRVIATNNAGVATTSALVTNRRVDNTSPSATMDNPGTPLSGTVTLTATASDGGSGLNSATFQYSLNGTGPWTPVGSDPSAPFSVNWDTTTVSDGRYYLRVIVTDVAGNTTTSASVVNRQVQNDPPFVDITAPGSYINAVSPSPFTVTANAAGDNSAVNNVEFFRCDNTSVNCSTGSFVSIGVDTTSPYSAPWAQASEPEGNRALKAVVTDNNFSSNQDILNVTIDRTAPSGSITAPGAGVFVGGPTVIVISDSADGLSGVAQVVFERSPTGLATWTAIDTDAVGPYSVSWDTMSLSDGGYDLRAVTTDLAGNSFSGPIRTVNVDNTGPTATQDDPGANLRASVTLTGSAADPAGTADVVFQRSPAGAGTWTTIDTDTSAPYSASFDTTAVADGLYDFRVVATDSVGNPTNSAAVTNRRVDNTSPSADQDDPGANLRVSVTLTGSAADTGGSGIAQVAFQRSPAGAGTWTTIDTDTSAPYSASFDTTAVSDGLYDVRVVATDVAGNIGNSPLVANRRVDNTPPSATMNDPGANLSGTVSLTSSTSDAGSGISTVTYQYSEAGLNNWTTTAANWNTTLVGDGLYDLRVIAADLAGNSTTSAPVINRRVDNGSPTVSITSPAAFVNGSDPDPFTVTASSPDNDLSGVEFFACDNTSTGCATGNWVSLGTDASDPFTISWNLPGTDGNRALRAVATDLAFNSGQDVANVTIDRSAPTGGSVSYLDGYDTTGSLTITTADGSDSGSGIDPASRAIQRDSVALSAGACDAFTGSWTTVTSPDSVASGNCYRYRYRVADFAGNVATYTSTGVAKVDTSAPSPPAFSFSGLTNAAGSGQTVYYRPGVAGGFTVTASSIDAQSGVVSYAFPALGSGWSGTQSGASYDYSFSPSAADPAEPNNATALNSAGLTSGPTSLTVTPDGLAPVSSIACDGSSCAGGWYTGTVSVSLSGSDSGSGLDEIRYTTDGSDPSPLNGTVYAAPFDISATTTVKFRAYDLIGNEEAIGSQFLQIDNSPPAAPALTLTESPASATQHVSGTTLYYNPQGTNSGSFAVGAVTGDAQSGIEKVTFSAVAGMSGGGDDPTSPYQGNYDWTSATAASGAQSVTSHNNAGLSSASSFTVTPDTAAPGGGSVDYPNGYASGPVTITTDTGNDGLSGIDAGSGVIERDSATLSAGVCGPFAGSWTPVTSPDSTIVSGKCYRYRFTAADNVGNAVVYTSPNVVKVASNGPSTPVLTITETPADPHQSVSGTTLYYNPSGSNAGTFTVNAVATDPESGIDRISFPAIVGMAGGGDDLTSPYQSSYDWTASTSASGARTVTARSNGGLTSSENFTVTPDMTPPADQGVDIDDGPYYTTLFVPLTLQDGTDAGAGIDASSGIVERQSATLSNDNCSSWSGGWTAVTLTGGADTTVAADSCYRYRYLISDNVDNQSSPSPDSGVAKVDVDVPVTGDDAPAGWRNAAVTVTLTPVDSGSGLQSTEYSVDGGAFQNGTSISIPAPADHSNDGAHTVEYGSTDNAGNAEPLRTATVRIDTTVPATTDDAPAGWGNSAVAVTLTPADALSGVASTEYRVDGGSFQNGTSISIPAPADHSNDGVHTIEYRSTDNAGNAEPLRNATVRIDTQLPNGALTAPADGAHVNGNVAISAAASDLPSGVASVEFRVRPNGSSSFTTISTDTTAPYDATWDSTSAAEGNAELKVVVVDNAGLSFTSALRTIVLDNPPVPTLDDPGANVSGTVTLTASSQPDTAQVVFEQSPAGAGIWTQIATDVVAPFSADLDTSGLLDGSYDLRAVATDGGGFGGTSSLRTSRVDNTAPTVSLSDPPSGAVVGGANVRLASLATDLGSGVASVQFEQRPAGIGAFTAIGTDATAPYETSWDTTGLDGGYELRAVATDAAGNPATAPTVAVTVDAAAASVTLSDPGTLVRDVVNLSATAPSLAVTSVAFERRSAGGSWTAIVVDTARPWGTAFDTKGLADGVYDLRAQALGSGGQVLATHAREGVRIDNTAPAVLSAAPADGSVVSSVTSIQLVASEPVAAVQGATLDGSAATGQVSGSSATFSTKALGAGAHVLAGSLLDAAGNAGSFSVRFTIRVKAHATLILRVNRPKTGVRGKTRVFSVPLTLSTAAHVQATLLSPSGRPLRTLRTDLSAGRHSLSFALPTASLPPGRYTILVVATGSDGSKVVKRIFVRIPAKRVIVKRGAPKATGSTEVAVPIAPASGPRGGGTGASSSPKPSPPLSKPEPKEEATPPKTRPLETASGYVSSEKSRRTIGLLIVLLCLGAALAFLIRIEMGRMFASPRRLS